MPDFRITVHKTQGGLSWVNRYFVQAADFAAAVVKMDQIVAAERPLYFPSVMITHGRVDDNAIGTDAFRSKSYNQLGTRTLNNTSESLPPFVVLRVDFSSSDGGRPSRKYLRTVLTELDIVGLTVQAGVLALGQTYANAVVAAGICDPSDFAITDGAPSAITGMRQVRRGSKKTVTP